jgi:ubiquinone biosynthesis UbiH/UbiF/VisC/COQ6 family hydroxylase
MNSQDVIILGAGIVGKAASLALARQGLRVIHLSADFGGAHPSITSLNPQNEWDSRIYALSASSQKLLADLQVWDAIPKDRAQAVRDMRVFGDSGNQDDHIHFSAFQGTVPQLAWIVESGQIEAALDLACKFQSGIQRITAHVKDFHTSAEGVTVETQEGQSFQAQLMIAADGANSPSRQKLGIETSVDDYDQTAVVANFEITQPHLQTAYQWFLPGGDILALLPLPEKRCSMVWSTNAANAERLTALGETNPIEFCQTVIQAANAAVSHELGALKLITAPKTFPLRRIWAKHVIGPETDPRVILVGDAAHVMHPLAGQGLNLGLRDIATLKEIFENKESFRSLHDKVLLRRFERQRQGDTQALLTTTHHLQKIFSNSSDQTKKIRNWGMKFLNKSSFIKRQLIQRALG